MKKHLLILAAIMAASTQALASPACAVCTIAIGASIGIARQLGVADSVVGLWAGALLTLLGYWTIVVLNKRGWNFFGRDIVVLALSVGMIGFIYINEVTYTPTIIWNIFHLDPILFASILGMFLFIYSQKLYIWLKTHNNGRAHFPFEKVALPLFFLIIASIYLNHFTI